MNERDHKFNNLSTDSNPVHFAEFAITRFVEEARKTSEEAKMHELLSSHANRDVAYSKAHAKAYRNAASQILSVLQELNMATSRAAVAWMNPSEPSL